MEGRLLAGRYRLLDPVGHGSMGTVWRARDELLHREVAVKEVRLPPGLAADQRAELCERTMREARTAAQVNHPSVVTVFDVVAEEGRPWIIMELIEARSLEQIVEQEGPLPPRIVAELGDDLVGALRAAHARGVLHRDVKPGNVLITGQGRVVLTDFGIAKLEGDPGLTRTGMVIGSPGYTAPERARGEYTGPESDLWSLGATLYFAVEGRPAYERESVMATVAALLSEETDPPRQAGPLRPLLEGMLRKNPAERITAEVAAAFLRRAAQGLAAAEEGPPPPSPPPRPGPGAPGRVDVRGPAQFAQQPPPPPPPPVEPPAALDQPVGIQGQDQESTMVLSWKREPPDHPSPAPTEDPDRTSIVTPRSPSGPIPVPPDVTGPAPMAGGIPMPPAGVRPAPPQRPGHAPPPAGYPPPGQAYPQPPAGYPPPGPPQGQPPGPPSPTDGLMTGVFGIPKQGGQAPPKSGVSKGTLVFLLGVGLLAIAVVFGLVVVFYF